MKVIRVISRIIIGLVFIFSGIVKAIDPLGSAYKFHDYFNAFNLDFLTGLSLGLAVLLCTAEFISGFAVITGLRQKQGIWVVMILMTIFTPLTFVLALTNPVSDCGCFGDAVHLTNWQTFGKNIILVGLALIIFITRKHYKMIFKPMTEWSLIFIAGVLFVLFNLYNLKYLPVIDFLPYKTGVKIADKMVIPETASPDVYSTTFIYEKAGVKKEFDLTNYPSGDSSWNFIEQKSVLLKKGYEPPIHDFVITSMNGEDLTQKILSDSGYSILMISKKLALAGSKHLSNGFEFGQFCNSNAIAFYVLTASGTDEVNSYNNGALFCQADETTLKTMIRANPGYILLKDGVIKGKWSWANLPDNNRFKEYLHENR
jgi:drug/metabolite transporter superfamily protein YnfA